MQVMHELISISARLDVLAADEVDPQSCTRPSVINSAAVCSFATPERLPDTLAKPS